MLRRTLPCIALSCIGVAPQAVFAEEPDELLATPVAQAFGAPPTVDDPMLSPDGAQLLFLQQDSL
ncbi:MAG: hypothetical protein OER87_21440, partial [Gammaproteobacteria bacterium]|nr:hypothetical protein [Gammaproteobacteria bacterium]